MPDEVKDVFSDVSEKATALVKVMEFQEWHRSRLMNYHRTIVRRLHQIQNNTYFNLPVLVYFYFYHNAGTKI